MKSARCVSARNITAQSLDKRVDSKMAELTLSTLMKYFHSALSEPL